jgi:hypothetical protein
MTDESGLTQAPAKGVSAVSNNGPIVQEISAAAYVIPTDTPEADGTLARDETTMVVVSARGGAASGIGWTYGRGRGPRRDRRDAGRRRDRSQRPGRARRG